VFGEEEEFREKRRRERCQDIENLFAASAAVRKQSFSLKGISV